MLDTTNAAALDAPLSPPPTSRIDLLDWHLAGSIVLITWAFAYDGLPRVTEAECEHVDGAVAVYCDGPREVCDEAAERFEAAAIGRWEDARESAAEERRDSRRMASESYYERGTGV